MASPLGGTGRGTPGSHRPIQLEDRPYYGQDHSPLEIPMGPGAGGLGRVGTPSDRLQGQPTVRAMEMVDIPGTWLTDRSTQ
jgi:hypothetical protein